MAKSRKRIRSPHPGVKLKRRTRPSGLVTWRAHYLDPGTGRETAITLDAGALPTKEARERWAKHLAAELSRRRMEHAAGVAPAKEPTSVDAAIAGYLATATARLRPKTIESHELGIAQLRAWAAREGVLTTEELTRPKLAALREHLIRQPKRSIKAGGRRGAHKTTARRRSPYTINRELASIKAVCNVWRTQGLLPKLHRDDLADALPLLPTPREEPVFLRPAELRVLVEAALRHDAATFDATRAEHALGSRRAPGGTSRYTPIAPFLAVLVLSGMRRGEALALEWAMVDLDALDHDGRVVGEIRLPATITKTKRARTIGLEVSPSLRRVLAALRLQRGHQDVRVFEGHTGHGVEAARRRMLATYGAPAFNWQALRSTCATYLTNAPGIFGAASVFLSARMLGHSVQVAERHYLGVHRGIARDAKAIEGAMQIEAELRAVLESCGAQPSAQPRARRLAVAGGGG